jgi:hypothetical protein
MWFISLVTNLMSLGFKRIKSDQCVMVLNARSLVLSTNVVQSCLRILWLRLKLQEI